ncbi:MAG TPA: c-type cytochrome [Sphingomonas sp.]|uniref:c-type cytochrome n=1 Tax=Sphingomonas sp. TaxID=28214 RepID=UPI002B5A80C3|nr:c-type cytochrome [Sphingomonas sp.]HMI19156.1 c-type cytochrome [Sphingomonas sp.]
MSNPLHPSKAGSIKRRRIAVAALLLALVTALGIRAHADHAQNTVLRADPEAILPDPVMRETTLREGRTVFAAHCASCHGQDGKGDRQVGVPDLTDDDHLFGSGLVSEIEDIARYGIRAHDSRGANLASMPAHIGTVLPPKGKSPPPQSSTPSLTPAQIEDVTQGLLWFTDHATDIAAARRGQKLFKGAAGCWDCHAGDAGGDPAIGAPALSDSVWLYGDGGHDAIYQSIAYGRAGMSPAFDRILTAAQLRDVAVYVASLAPTKASRR